MKKLSIKTISVIGLFIGAFGASQASAAIEPATEQKLERICKALKSDNPLALNQAVKLSRISYKTVAQGLRCNGMTALEFAKSHGSTITADLLIAKTEGQSSEMFAKR